MITPELLAPAGDLECFEAALRFGADAVYLGGQAFGMRSAPKNFTPEQLTQAVALAHKLGKRVYVTCNILPHPADMKQFPAWLEAIAQAGTDAIVAADLGVVQLAQKYAPGVELHISTQAGITNAEAARIYHEIGAKRVILARELTLEEIREIRKNTPQTLEIECFVHGAMCVSFSGRCLLSNYLTGRDANSGACAQPCRWSYALVEETRPGQYIPIEEDTRGTHIMHAKDLCMIAHIPELLDAGIASLKIEGRAKAAYYVAVAVNAYRVALDAALQNKPLPAWVLEEPQKLSHREYCTGFYFNRPNEAAQINLAGGYRRQWEVIGIVERWADGVCYAIQRGRAFAGDTLEALSPGQMPAAITLDNPRDTENNLIEATRHSEMQFSFRCDFELPKGTVLRRKCA